VNYFAHGRHFIDDPYFLVGTALPDWLRVVDRRARAPSKRAAALVDSEDLCLATVARGVMQHHRDDEWFHQTRAFAELMLQFTVAIRDCLPRDDSMRPSFLGHILVELLLDAELIAGEPQRLDDYYAAFETLDAAQVESAVTALATQPIDDFPLWLERFCRVRFLYDYADDGKLLKRLNGVMARVGLPALPNELLQIIPEARRAVRERQEELLTPID
jgi:hypothetical protein